MTKQIPIADGKYVFILNDRDLITDVLRNGEPWVQGKVAFQFNNCINAMLHELVELRAVRDQARELVFWFNLDNSPCDGFRLREERAKLLAMVGYPEWNNAAKEQSNES